MAKLTLKQQRFIEEYLIDLNATQAAIRAGYSERTAYRTGADNLKKPQIQAALSQELANRSARTEITADMVLQRWWDIATADANDIIHLRRTCCRHCYGQGYQYQWRDEDEYAQAVSLAARQAGEEETPLIPSDAGGYGFNRLLDPNRRCPYCLGEGQPELHIADTRKLSGKAKLLYAGIKQTQAGIEVKLQDQGKALENVARHLGMFLDRHEISGPGGGPVQIEALLESLDDS